MIGGDNNKQIRKHTNDNNFLSLPMLNSIHFCYLCFSLDFNTIIWETNQIIR